MSNDWNSRSKRWKESHLTALKALYGKENIASEHRSLVTPLPTYRVKRKSVARAAVESERGAQIRLVQWLIERDIPFYAIPNGANVAPHHRQTLLAEGMSPGAPDLCVPRARGKYHGLYIELKRADGGSGLSDEQKQWLKVLKEEGYYAVKCDGFDKAVETLTWYLGLDGGCVDSVALERNAS